MTDELKVKSGSAHWRHKFCTVMTDLSRKCKLRNIASRLSGPTLRTTEERQLVSPKEPH